MKVVLFEDADFQNLLPLVYFRPVWELRCGARLLKEKIQFLLPQHEFRFIARQYLMDFYLSPETRFLPSEGEETLFINGRLLIDEETDQAVFDLASGEAVLSKGQLVAFRTGGKKAIHYFSEGIVDPQRVLNELRVVENDSLKLVQYPWDLIMTNGEHIRFDFQNQGKKGEIQGKLEAGVHLLNPEEIYLGSGSRLMPGVVLNAEQGPIWIDPGVTLMPNAVVEGPVYIGEKSLIKTGAKIYENTSIGPVCKVGGEVEATIFRGYANKQHDGFLGHSYICPWVNLGADTNNSDLRNDYGHITVYLNGYPRQTEERFLGLIMGDHSKSAINTMFNTGTIVGVGCNIYSAGFPPKFIPSFTRGGDRKLRQESLKNIIQIARTVMQRRGIELTERHEALFEAIFDMSHQYENRSRVR